MKVKQLFLILASLTLGLGLWPAVLEKTMDSSEIKLAIEKLEVLGSVLYIAAHPDDENTALLAWLSKEKLVRTGYLSLTRGGGGQNLIGTEKGPLLSALRTQELLSARDIDGSEQFFTRAKDFGYSKTAEESIKIWDRESILSDIVYVIRKFRPDLLITRFPTDGGGHGHHKASAILAIKAFEAAGDPNKFPGQLKKLSVWQPKRILWNTWRPRLKGADPEETKKLLKIDIGMFNRLLGKSYLEIAALSRSMHRSQGFGAVARRGTQWDYYQVLKGPAPGSDIFGGIELSWDRVPGSGVVSGYIKQAIKTYDPNHPYRSVPLLIKTLKEFRKLPDSYWIEQKKKEISKIIRSSTGFWFEAVSNQAEINRNTELQVTVTMINRSPLNIFIKNLFSPDNREIDPGFSTPQQLKDNLPYSKTFSIIINSDYSHPHWLKRPGKSGVYNIDKDQRGQPVAPYPNIIKTLVTIEGIDLEFTTPIIYRWREPAKGEKIQKLEVIPPVSINFGEQILYFQDNLPRKINLLIRNGSNPVSGIIQFDINQEWKILPASIPIELSEPFIEKTVTVGIQPPKNETSTQLKATVTIKGKKYSFSRQVIDYQHIPKIYLHPPSVVKVIKVDIRRSLKRIGYIMGSGDDIPKYLSLLGYNLQFLSDKDLQEGNLNKFDSIISGVRAYNTRDILKNINSRLMDYVKQGGRYIVQYNVSRGLKSKNIGPYPFRISRGRVSEEAAPITILNTDNPVFNYPNQIRSEDFQNWIQERGLYFSDTWDPKYTPLLSAADSGEPALEGGALYARYGKGVFIYTGYSFFRQIPAGVPGALKLFINMVEAK